MGAHRSMLAIVAGAVALAGCGGLWAPIGVEKPSSVNIPIDAVRGLDCDFRHKHAATLTGWYKPETHSDKMPLRFSELDRRAGTARLVGNNGGGTVSYEVSAFAANVQGIFIERTMSGNINVTTVFFPTEPITEYVEGQTPVVRGPSAVAVQSRHTMVGGVGALPVAVVSQYVGVCGIRAG